MASQEERALRTALVRNATPGTMPVEAQRMLDERKAINLVAAKIAGMSWGQSIDLESRRALAEYGRQKGIDVTTEIFILGNRIYKNAEYYLNRAQPFVRSGVIALDYEYINNDKRLDTLAQSNDIEVASKAKAEIERRMQLRIEYNVAENAQSAVLATISLPKHGTQFRQAKWCGNGVRKGDPVGDGNPEATAITRALRKVIKMAVGYEPSLQVSFGDTERDVEEAVEMSAIIGESKAHERLIAAECTGQTPASMGVVNTYDDINQPIDRSQPVPIVNAEGAGRMPIADLAKIASAPDPYGEQELVHVDFSDNRYADEPKAAPAAPPADEPIVEQAAPVAEAPARRVYDPPLSGPDDPRWYDGIEEEQAGLGLDDARPKKRSNDALREG